MIDNLMSLMDNLINNYPFFMNNSMNKLQTRRQLVVVSYLRWLWPAAARNSEKRFISSLSIDRIGGLGGLGSLKVGSQALRAVNVVPVSNFRHHASKASRLSSIIPQAAAATVPQATAATDPTSQSATRSPGPRW
jgi:hypothetical protein